MKEMSKAIIQNLFENVYGDIPLHKLVITVQTRGLPSGGCFTVDPFLKTRSKYLSPANTDNRCGQICIAMQILGRQFQTRYTKDPEKSPKKLVQTVKAVCDIVGHSDEMSFEDFDKLGVKHRVIIIGCGFSVVYDTHDTLDTASELTTYLYYGFETKHYTLVQDINTFTNDSSNYRWCHTCLKRHTIA